jgi:N-acylneuraminate cytidylyltransferase/CMP-N,N'-diacetyllegionaminic acid synthase
MIALIPARGGSKGLFGKNIKLLNGKPLIAYTIEAALKANSILAVYVSTDCAETAAIARKYGALVPALRPAYLATDSALAIDLYQFMLLEWEKEGLYVENFMVLQPTSPLRKVKHIEEAIALFYEKKADSVISYTPEAHPISWHKYISEALTFEPIFDDKLANRQSLKKSYYPNGSIYIFKKNLIQQNLYFSEKSFAYLMDRKYSVDIDYQDDFDYATFLLSKQTEL